MAARSHRDLVVWHRAMALVERIYHLTAQFPPGERFVLSHQLRRAAISVPTNIAEGNGRGSVGDYARFVSIARGSLMEVETLILLATRLDHTTPAAAASCLDEIDQISRMLSTLRRRLRQSIRPSAD